MLSQALQQLEEVKRLFSSEATSWGCYDIVGLLAEGNIHACDTRSGGTALHWASKAGNIDLIQRLLSLGADVRAQDKVRGEGHIVHARGPERGHASVFVRECDACINMILHAYLILCMCVALGRACSLSFSLSLSSIHTCTRARVNRMAARVSLWLWSTSKRPQQICSCSERLMPGPSTTAVQNGIRGQRGCGQLTRARQAWRRSCRITVPLSWNANIMSMMSMLWKAQ